MKTKTVIEHRIRKKLNVSNDEYIICDAIFQIKGIHLENREIEELTSVAIAIKIDSTFIKSNIVKNLEHKGLLEEKNGGIYTTSKWNDCFIEIEEKTQKEFNELWEIYGKVGSKANALKMYKRARREISFIELKEKILKYLKFREWLKDNEKFVPEPKHFSTFLNPTVGIYNDNYEIEEKEKKESPIKT